MRSVVGMARRAAIVAACALAAALPAGPARAQFGTARRAFEWAVTPWIGASGFGTRYTTPGFGTRYSSSLAGGLRGDLPLTRRLGILANVEVAPFARQKTSDESGSAVLTARTYLWRGDVGIGWRFKPVAPVFFYAGGGVVGASRPSYPGFIGSVLDPQAAVGVGLDRPSTGRVNFRAAYTAYFVFPRDLTATDWAGSAPAPHPSAKSGAYDWALQFGLRIRRRPPTIE